MEDNGGDHCSSVDKLLEEFRKIGRDSAYNPESEEVIANQILSINEGEISKDQYQSLYAQWFSFLQELCKKTSPAAFCQPVKVGSNVCSFCRKNGETYAFYSSHRLKDELDRICCPILYKYVCPTCHATGDNAHTKLYCPYNGVKESTPLITRLKGLRNSMGKRRGRYNQ